MGLCGVRADMMRSACGHVAECVEGCCGVCADMVRSLCVGRAKPFGRGCECRFVSVNKIHKSADWGE